ncbi:hypothetical protein CSKR_104246 [Clonorchis sinensis]|uniref:Uncharacterized protein n=1 Tax=Clonorchis sinensis TaxID=79923 RepID=A0A8T1M1P7_CLOSI|nr:hypothetical protein CSKR_104246 [Clonorchis sinensis]
MGERGESEGILETIFKKESEWKELFLSEIQRLMALSVEHQKELNEKCDQLEQLKKAFTHNLNALKERDSAIHLLKSQVSELRKTLYEKDILLTETKSSVDQYQSQLELATSTEKQLRSELEACRKSNTSRELELRQQHADSLHAVRQMQLEEKAQLQATITRLQVEIETEQLRSATELEATVEKVCSEAERAAANAGQKQLGLELQLSMLEEMKKRAMCAKEEAMRQVDTKKAEINDLQVQLTRTQKDKQSLTMEIGELESKYAASKEAVAKMEASHRQEENKWKSGSLELKKQMDDLRADITSCKNELNSVLQRNEETRIATEAEKRELLEALSRAREETRVALEYLKEANASRKMMDKNARIARNEAERLRKDLEQALTTAANGKSPTVSCKHEYLIEQLNRLQNHCEQLEQENDRLRKSVNMMSEEASQVVQQQTKQVPLGSSSDSHDDIKVYQKKLHVAVNIIRQLAREKQALTELSNRLHAQVRQLENVDNAFDKGKDERLMEKINPPRSAREASSIVPDICVGDYDDAISSIIGKDSVSAIFHLLDENASQLSDPRNPSSYPGPPNLVVCGGQKPLRFRSPRTVNTPKSR